MLAGRITLHGLNRAEEEISPDFDIPQLIPALRESGVQQGGKADVGGVVHPVPALNGLDRLLRGSQLLPVLFLQHGSSLPYLAASRPAR